MSIGKLYVAEFCGKEYKFEANPDHRYLEQSLRRMAELVLRESGITTKRSDPQEVKVDIFAIDVKKGAFVHRLVAEYKIQPPLAPMTKEEFESEEQKILSELPVEFRQALSSMGYEIGHSSGYEEVISYLRDFVSNFVNPIKEYTERIKSTERIKQRSMNG